VFREVAFRKKHARFETVPSTHGEDYFTEAELVSYVMEHQAQEERKRLAALKAEKGAR
jgi:hypothetical protein